MYNKNIDTVFLRRYTLMSKRILIIGSANMELVMGVENIPLSSQTAIEENMSFDYLPGGRGANAALTAARLGADSIFCTKVGNDTYGEQLTELYNMVGIDTRFVTVHGDAKTGMSVSIFESDGKQRSIIYPGANSYICDYDIEDAFMSYPDAVFVGLDAPYEAIKSAYTYSAEQGIPMVVYSNPLYTDFPLSELGKIEIFIVDEGDLSRYTRHVPSSIENTLRAAIDVASAVKANYYIIKLGERASFIYDGKYYNIAPSPDVPISGVHDTSDYFGAALTLEYAKSRDIVRACTLANIVGVMTAKNDSSAMPMPTGAEVRAFMEKHDIKL